MTIAETKPEMAYILPRMASLKEASTISPFTYYALRKMCFEGKVAHIRVGGKIYINMDDLARIMNGGRAND